MSTVQFERLIAASLKASVALFPLMIGTAFTPAFAQAPAATSAPAPEAEAEDDTGVKSVGAKSDDEQTDEEKKSVVITGTSIRNAPPTGTNVISVDKEGIKASGANSAAELLANIPQAGSGFFNDIPQLGGGNSQAAGGAAGNVLKPNARGLPGGSTDSGSSTLVLLDGQRMVGTGTNQNAPDINSVPVALLERVEINTDGGSSVYGSDGIGGVVNFVTRRRFDGVQVYGRYGIADDYHNYEVGGIAGKDFGKANVYVSFSRAGNDEIFNGERDYYRVLDYDYNGGLGGETGTSCALPNVRIGTTGPFFGVDANGNISSASGNADAPVTANGIQSPNVCTNGKLGTLTPRSVRNSGFVSFSYDFTDDVKLTVRGRYADSKNTNTDAPYGTSTSSSALLVPCTAPNTPAGCNTNYTPIPGQNPSAGQQVFFSFQNVLTREQLESERKFQQYGISPELTWNVDGNWQVRAFVNYEKNKTRNFSRTLDTTAMNAAIAAGTLNPYHIEDTDPALIADLTDGYTRTQSNDEILNGRITADGALFELPGGKVRAAIGAEYLKDKFGSRTDPTVPFPTASRNIKSVFGELNVPVVSSLNSGPLFQELRFAFSGRYDKYSDFGDTFNPRFGMTYAPFKWLRLRGNWGTTFRAPTVVDTLGAQTANVLGPIGLANVQALIDPERPLVVNADTGDITNQVAYVYINVPSPNLRPETSKNWSVAGEIRPIDGLRAELSYYKIDYKDRFGFPPFLQPGFYPSFANIVTVYPCGLQPGPCAALDEFLSVAANAQTAKDALNGRTIYGLFDGRTANLGVAKIEGLDYSARYDFNTPIGAAYVSANGNIQLVSKSQANAIAPFINNLALGTPNHRVSITAGLRSGGFRTQLTLNHTDGYKVTPTATLHQSSVDAYNLVNAFFSYEFTEGELGMGKAIDGLELTLNIQNVFDTDPPKFYLDGGSGYTNGGTLGRLIQVGFRKNF